MSTLQTTALYANFTLSPPIPLRLYTLPYRSNLLYLIFDIRALWRSGLIARAPECQKLKNGGLDQYGAEPSERQQFGTAGTEWVNLYAERAECGWKSDIGRLLEPESVNRERDGKC